MTPNLLEQLHNTVTKPVNEYGAHFEVAKCRCNCWFCPECCKVMGYQLRVKLVPILETFDGLILVSLTVDPELFPDPQTAYFYTMDKRCISVTTQDLHRWNHLSSRRYFYVVEWQQNTEQAHYHVLYDSNYIPWDLILKSWSKHRPKSAGPLIENRPVFGTVLFSKPDFEGDPLHAARYVTKYLIKTPEHGYPRWVLEMGKDRRIRRYSTSRGFWGNPTKRRSTSEKQRSNTFRTYAERIKNCGDSVYLFEIIVTINPETGEITPRREWLGQLDVKSSTVLNNLWDPGNPERARRSLLASSLDQAKRTIDIAAGKEVQWLRRKFLRSGGIA